MGNRYSSDTESASASDLGLPSLQNYEKFVCLQIIQSVILCYSTPNRLKQATLADWSFLMNFLRIENGDWIDGQTE
jgi:hypothetical protein